MKGQRAKGATLENSAHYLILQILWKLFGQGIVLQYVNNLDQKMMIPFGLFCAQFMIQMATGLLLMVQLKIFQF